MINKPLILISLDYSEDNTYSDFPWYALRRHYSDAVETSGGIPLFIPYSFNLIEYYLEIADGILVPGGDVDIPPHYYQETYIHKETQINHERIKFDFYFIEKVLKKKIPFLGICAGQQVLNTILGGSIIQHIPDEIENPLNHKSEIRNIPSHTIKIDTSSLLYKIIKKEETKVNSNHHQAVKKLGKNLIASAIAPDGIIEAIEHINHPFCLGVEWHPEYLETNDNKEIFTYFIKQALIYKNSKLTNK